MLGLYLRRPHLQTLLKVTHTSCRLNPNHASERRGIMKVKEVRIIVLLPKVLREFNTTGNSVRRLYTCQKPDWTPTTPTHHLAAHNFWSVYSIPTLRQWIHRPRLPIEPALEKWSAYRPRAIVGEYESGKFGTWFKKVTTLPALLLPKYDSPYSVDTDVSNYQVGAALFH